MTPGALLSVFRPTTAGLARPHGVRIFLAARTWTALHGDADYAPAHASAWALDGVPDFPSEIKCH